MKMRIAACRISDPRSATYVHMGRATLDWAGTKSRPSSKERVVLTPGDPPATKPQARAVWLVFGEASSIGSDMTRSVVVAEFQELHGEYPGESMHDAFLQVRGQDGAALQARCALPIAASPRCRDGRRSGTDPVALSRWDAAHLER